MLTQSTITAIPNLLATYAAEAAIADGAKDKILLGLLNPAASGKTYKVWAFWVLVPAASGSPVIIPVELRSITTLTAGTDVTPFAFDETDAASGATVKADAPTVTDVALILTRIFQVNSAQYSQGYEVPLKLGDSAKPLMLAAGKGVCLKMVASNTSTFRVGVLWTQE